MPSERSLIKPSIVKLHKLSAIDIDLWMERKAPILDSEPVKPTQIQTVKDTMYDGTNPPVSAQTSGKLAPKGPHTTNKGKRKFID